MSDESGDAHVYRAIRQRLIAEGNLAEPGIDFLGLMLRTLGLAGSWAWLMSAHGLSLVIASVFAGFFAIQFGGIGHDAGHYAVSRHRLANVIAGVWSMTIVLGIGFECWCRGHTKHHAHTQVLGRDPDLEFEFISLTAERSDGPRRGITRLHYLQGWYLPLLIPLFVWRKRVESIKLALSNGPRVWRDRVGLVGYALLWFVVPSMWASWSQILAANFAVSCVISIYLFLIFVTNHVGMPIATAGESRLQRQIAHTRNLRVRPLFDFFFNGLNFHIEHHLFPRVPMHRLRACQPAVRDGCREHGIHYTEQDFGAALRETFAHLRGVAATLAQQRGS